MEPLRAKIALYPNYASCYEDALEIHLNPEVYSKVFHIPIQVGEYLQPIYVWQEGNRGYLNDQGRFPGYLPLKWLLDGKEGKKIYLKIGEQDIELTCAQRESRCPETDFEFNLGQSKERVYVRNTQSGKLELCPLYIKYYEQAQKRAKELADAGGCQAAQEMEQLGLKASHPLCSMDNAALFQRFKYQRAIGGGGSGSVFEVIDKTNDRCCALKCSSASCFAKPVIPLLNQLLDKELTPHLTRMYEQYTHFLSLPASKTLERGPAGLFFKEGTAEGRKVEFTLYLMERMEGDMEKKYATLSKTEQAAFQIQIASTHLLLQSQYGITISDDKLRNILYRKLTAEDRVEGKRLQDFDYWKYEVGGMDFHLPRSTYIFKLADYDEWQTTYFERAPCVPSTKVQREKVLDRLQSVGFSLEQAQQLFSKPRQGSILPMPSSSAPSSP
jgi:hypothetical protein